MVGPDWYQRYSQHQKELTDGNTTGPVLSRPKSTNYLQTTGVGLADNCRRTRSREGESVGDCQSNWGNLVRPRKCGGPEQLETSRDHSILDRSSNLHGTIGGNLG